jgi:hypothetical protein
MSGQENAATHFRLQNRQRPPQTFTVSLCAARERRPVRTRLPERQIEPQHSEPGCDESIRHVDEQF